MPSPSRAEKDVALELARFIDASPTPHFAAATIAARLGKAGFTELLERDAWRLSPGDKRYVIRGGTTVIAFVVGEGAPAESGFRIIGAHTDSPNLRIKPRFDVKKAGYRQVGVEVYGGALLTTWLDRDLSIAGRVSLARGKGIASRLVRFDRAVARVPNLAIHMNRGVNTDGLVLNPQKHLAPIVGLGDDADLASAIAAELGEDKKDVLGFDLALFDVAPSLLSGLDEEFLVAPRLDNLGSSFAAMEAIVQAATGKTTDASLVIVLYDHEECGSRSAVGAQGTALKDVLERIVSAHPMAAPQAFERAMRASFLVSADMAHAVHPNYEDKHEPEHQPKLGAGVVIKTNVNQSYATNGETAARFTLACREAGFEPQQYVVRSDLPCGSTIGPITSALLGIDTVDVGAPMLSMHSCRELAGTRDVSLAVAAYTHALSMRV